MAITGRRENGESRARRNAISRSSSSGTGRSSNSGGNDEGRMAAAEAFAEITRIQRQHRASVQCVLILAPREVYLAAERRLPRDGCILHGGRQLKRRDFIRNVTVAGVVRCPRRSNGRTTPRLVGKPSGTGCGIVSEKSRKIGTRPKVAASRLTTETASRDSRSFGSLTRSLSVC